MANSPPTKRKCPGPRESINENEGTIAFIAPKISEFKEGQILKSEIQHVGGFPWRIRFLRGRHPSRQMIIVVICENNTTSNMWYCDATVSITIVNQEDPKKSIIKEIDKRYSQTETDCCCGFPRLDSSFSESSPLPLEEFIKDDSISFKVSIKIKSELGTSFRSKTEYDFFSPSELADAILVVEEKEFHVSRQLLAVQSSYFKALFFREYKEKNQEKIPLHNIAAQDFERLLRFVYRIDTVFDIGAHYECILRLADMYDMKSIIDEAEKLLLSAKNVKLERKLLFADQYKLKVLLDQCLKEVTSETQILKLKKTEEYKLYSDGFKVKLLEMFTDFFVESIISEDTLLIPHTLFSVRQFGGIRIDRSIRSCKAVPSGKWQHDMFESVEKASTRPFKSTFLNSFVDGNKKVRLNISNLASTVATADLKELFSPYSISSAFVHYGENGEALGTGEVAMKKKDAQKAINAFKGVSVDGSRIRLAIVDAGESIFNRVQMVKKVEGREINTRTVNPRPQKARVGKKMDEGRLFSLDLSNVKKSSKGRGKAGKIPKKAMNEEELNAELDQYMKTTEN